MHISAHLSAISDGLVQERHNSIANALELRLSCTIISYRQLLFPGWPYVSVFTSIKGYLKILAYSWGSSGGH